MSIDVIYAAAFVGSLALALVFTPLALRIALRRQVLDHPGDHKSHESPIPYLGGVAICAAFSVAALVGAALLDNRYNNVGDELMVAFALGLGLCVMGLIDDLRGVGLLIRIGVEIAAAVLLYTQGVGVELSNSGAVNIALTIVWVVGITNAFNLLDNMDGLSAGVAAIAAGAFFTIAAAEGQELVALLALALAGCALGFLRHNFHPARIYMGDAGSLFLGFMLAFLGMKLRFTAPTDVTLLVPILVLTVPILDTTLVTACRMASGRSPFAGGRDHASHRLLHVGLSVRWAVGLIYAATVATGVVALVVRDLSVRRAWVLSGIVFLGAIVAGVLLARVPVYAASDSERGSGSATVLRLKDRQRRRAS